MGRYFSEEQADDRECEFEIHADERLIKTKPMSYEEAKHLIVLLSGYREPQWRECL